MSTPRLRVRDLTLGYGSFVLMRDVNFDVAADDIFLIMGGSGCGKSSLLRTLMGLKQPQSGQVLYGDTDIWACTEKSAAASCGVRASSSRAAPCGAP